MKRRSFLILNLLFVLSLLLAGCQGAVPGSGANVPAETKPRINPSLVLPKAVKSFPKIAERNPNVDKDYEALAETDALRLYVRKASGAIIIEDKRSGYLWRSSPEGLAQDKITTTAWRRSIESPIQVGYVDAERAQTKTARPDRNVTLKLSPVENGVQALYTYDQLKLQMGVVFALKDDCLEASIPNSTVKETGSNGFTSVDLLAFLGATHDGEEGYIVYPDGSGAVMRYDTPHTPDVQKITTVIYGSDASGGLIGFSPGVFREQVTMPVFGMVRGSGDKASGYVGIVTQGDFDASLGIGRAGKGVNYNHVWTTLTYRRQGRFSLTGGQPTWLFQPDRITSDRSVRFCFLNGKDADYVGMANRYRDFLIQERGAHRIGTNKGAGEQTTANTSLPKMHLGFFMGIERKNWFLADMISMTTFAEASAILRDLEKAGVKNLDVSLWFWNHGGTAGKFPERLPADERLGGAAGLQALSAEVHSRGQRLFLQDDYLSVAPGATGVVPYLHAIRGVDGLPIGSADTGYLLSPQVALRSFAGRDIPKMKSLGADGLELQNFGFLTLPDKNQIYPLSRENFAGTWMQIAALSTKTFGSVAVEGNNIYTLPYIDRMDFIPVDSTHFDLFDSTIPFYHIAVHGLVQYTNTPFNLSSDGKRVFLRQVEYGAMPFFLLTQGNSAQLFRTNANSIYSSQYSYWRNEVIIQYKAVEKLAPLADQFITGHAQLADNVYQTTYEDGSRVIVNYGLDAYSAGNVQVPAQDFIVVGGK